MKWPWINHHGYPFKLGHAHVACQLRHGASLLNPDFQIVHFWCSSSAMTQHGDPFCLIISKSIRPVEHQKCVSLFLQNSVPHIYRSDKQKPVQVPQAKYPLLLPKINENCILQTRFIKTSQCDISWKFVLQFLSRVRINTSGQLWQRGSIVVKPLCYKPESRGFEALWVEDVVHHWKRRTGTGLNQLWSSHSRRFFLELRCWYARNKLSHQTNRTTLIIDTI
jgi:hypothetical protein